MIVEPAPAARPGRGRRGLRVAALGLPVVLLAGVVTAGALGPKPEPAPVQPPVANDPATPGPSGPAPALGTAPAPVFPTVAADLGVLTIVEAAARIELGDARPLAVKGYLAEVGTYPPCPAAEGDPRGDLGPLCLRHARLETLADDPEHGPHLDLTIAPGARMPGPLERRGGPGRAVPVVLVGHRGARPDPCHPTTAECGGLLVVERVTWADGEAFEPGPILDTYLDLAPPGWPLSNLETGKTLAIGWSGTILQAALVHRSTVARIDADAASTMAPSPTEATLVWYVLGLETGYDPSRHLHGSAPPRYSWVVVDYVTGETLARGPAR